MGKISFNGLLFSKRIQLFYVAFLSCLLLLGISVSAIDGLSQGYSTNDQDLLAGMVVSLSRENNNEGRLIERSSRSNLDNFVGVVTTVDRSLLTLTGADEEVLVVSSGDVDAYISDINGPVNPGDRLTVSPLTGVLMKASDNEKFIVGSLVAEEVFDEFTRDIQINNDQQRSVDITKQTINLKPVAIPDTNREDKPFLVLIGESVTGKSVNQLQVIAALTILILVLVVEGSIIYGAIHGSIHSIGRNPLAKRAIYKQLLQVLWLTLLVLVFGLGSIYLILWA